MWQRPPQSHYFPTHPCLYWSTMSFHFDSSNQCRAASWAEATITCERLITELTQQSQLFISAVGTQALIALDNEQKSAVIAFNLLLLSYCQI